MSTTEVSEPDLAFIDDLLRRETAIVLGDSRKYLVASRLKPVAERHGYADVPALIAAVRRGGGLLLRQAVLESLATNETYFFRDDSFWRQMQVTTIPEMMRRRAPEKRLSVWCGASSTGQEPYSLAMLLADEFPALADWTVRIVASDVDRSAVERAREGLYDHFEVNRGMPARRMIKHFERDGLRWRARQALRSRVDFRVVNLARPWPDLGRPDLVLLRNVLIYFDVPTRRAVLERAARLMAPDGFLFMAASEVSHPVQGLLRSVDRPSGTWEPAGVRPGLPAEPAATAARPTTNTDPLIQRPR